MDSSSINAILESARESLKDGELEKAEISFAKVLLHNPAVEPVHQVTSFVALGDIYQQRDEPECFPKACGLYRAALIKCKEQSICQQISDKLAKSEEKFLHLYAKPGASCGDSSLHKMLVEKIQEELKEKLSEIPTSYHPGQETVRAIAIRKISVDTSEAIKTFFRVLFEECLEAIGEAPCKYAVIGLGSLARKETTPYSDIEFAILLEENQDSEKNREFFRIVTHYLHLKVVNLGTTIIPALGISSLNDFYGGEDLFYDDFTPQGLSFDGAMPWASKIPTGRGATETKEALELIQTPMKMAAFQKTDSIIKEGYHLADVLSCITLLDGEERLLDDYQKEVQKCHQEQTVFDQYVPHVSTRMFYGFNLLLSDVVKFNYTKLPGDINQAEGILEVKSEVYRMPSTLLQGLAMYFGITCQSSWERIEALEEQGVLTSAAAKNLLIACSISVEFRLRAYSANGSQKDKMSVVSQQLLDESSVIKFFQIPDQQLLFQFYYTALPFYDMLEEALVSIINDSTQVLNLDKFLKEDLFDDSNKVKGIISYKLKRYEKAVDYLEKAKVQQSEDFEICKILGIIFHETEKFKEAMKYNEAALAIAKKQSNSHKSKQQIACALDGIGCNLSELGMFKEAVEKHKEAIKLQEGIEGSRKEHLCASYINLGLALEKVDQLDEAKECYKDAMRILTEVLGIKGTHRLKPKILNNFGILEVRKNGHTEAAEKYFQEAIAMNKLLSGNCSTEDMAISLSNLGTLYIKMEGHKRTAISMISKALALTRKASGTHESKRVFIATMLTNLSSAHMEVSEIDKAVECALEAKSLLEPVRDEWPGEWMNNMLALARAFEEIKRRMQVI